LSIQIILVKGSKLSGLTTGHRHCTPGKKNTLSAIRPGLLRGPFRSGPVIGKDLIRPDYDGSTIRRRAQAHRVPYVVSKYMGPEYMF